MYVKIKPWMELADDDMFVFNTDKIITMSEIKDQKVIKIYQRYDNYNEKIYSDLLQLLTFININKNITSCRLLYK